MDAAGPFLPRREVQRRRSGAITHVYKPGKSPVSPQKEEEEAKPWLIQPQSRHESVDLLEPYQELATCVDLAADRIARRQSEWP